MVDSIFFTMSEEILFVAFHPNFILLIGQIDSCKRTLPIEMYIYTKKLNSRENEKNQVDSSLFFIFCSEKTIFIYGHALPEVQYYFMFHCTTYGIIVVKLVHRHSSIQSLYTDIREIYSQSI